MAVCRVHECAKEARAAKGLCWGHYNRLRRYDGPINLPPKPTVIERVLARTSQPAIGCWLYDGWYDTRSPRAADATGRSRRVAEPVWEAEYGPIPLDGRLDSLCLVRGCVRLDHHVVRARRAA